MSVAVERVGIGDFRVQAGVIVSDEVRAALDLGRIGPEHGGIRGERAVREGRLERRDGPGAAEVRVRVIDARVDDRDLHPLAAEAGDASPDLRDAEERKGRRVCGGERLHGGDAHDRVELGEARELRPRDLDRDAVVGDLVLRDDASSERFDRRDQRVLSRLQFGFDRVLLCGSELHVGHLGFDDGDRIAR